MGLIALGAFQIAARIYYLLDRRRRCSELWKRYNIYWDILLISGGDKQNLIKFFSLSQACYLKIKAFPLDNQQLNWKINWGNWTKDE